MTTLAGTSILISTGLSQIAYLLAHRRKIDPARPPSRSVPGFRAVYPLLMVSLFVVGADLVLWRGMFTAALEPPASVVLSGVVLQLLGMAVFAWARASLGEHYSPCFAARRPRAVVRHGAYRWLRHPMYVGNLTLIAGAVVVSGAPLLAALWGVTALCYWRSARQEEEELQRVRGDGLR